MAKNVFYDKKTKRWRAFGAFFPTRSKAAQRKLKTRIKAEGTDADMRAFERALERGNGSTPPPSPEIFAEARTGWLSAA